MITSKMSETKEKKVENDKFDLSKVINAIGKSKGNTFVVQNNPPSFSPKV